MTVGLYLAPNPLVIATDVDQALLDTLQMWMPTYLRLVAGDRQLGYELPAPNTYANTLETDEWMDHQLPAVVVTTAKAEAAGRGSLSGGVARGW